MIHEHVVLGITLLTEESVIVVLPTVEVLGIMDILLDSLRGRSIPNSPDMMALAAIMNRWPCEPRFRNLVGMPVININFTNRIVSIQDPTTTDVWMGSFEQYITAHTKRDFSAGSYSLKRSL